MVCGFESRLRHHANTINSMSRFSHVPYATDYMAIAVELVRNHFEGQLAGRRILDIPAGNGWVSDELSRGSAEAVSADINEERSDYAQVDMERTLPFSDGEFDAVVSLEGIEHVLNPEALFAEFARILKPGGMLVLSTPNVQNFYSRWQFFCTGYLFQFDPFNKVTRGPLEQLDRGHVSPVTLGQLLYWTEQHGMRVAQVTGGRMKKLLYLPLFLPFILLGFYWAWSDWKKTSGEERTKSMLSHYFGLRTLLSRSLVFAAVKPAQEGSG